MTDLTWTFTRRTTWTVVEANTGIICACLPLLRKPLFELWPWGKSRSCGSDVGNRHVQSPDMMSDFSVASIVRLDSKSFDGKGDFTPDFTPDLESQAFYPRSVERVVSTLDALDEKFMASSVLTKDRVLVWPKDRVLI